MPWAMATPGAAASAKSRKPHADPAAADQAPSAPRATAPQMPSPPSQTLSASTRVAALAPVGVGGRDDVVEPAADDAGDDGVCRDVEHLPRLTSAGAHPAVGQPDRHDDAEQDAQGVAADRQRAEVEDPGGGARDRRRGSLGGCLDRGREAGRVAARR